LLELLRGADHLFEVGGKRLRRHTHNPAHFAHVLASLSFVDLIAMLARPQVAKREQNMGRHLLGPVFEQLLDVNEAALVQNVEGPPGSGNDFASNPRPIKFAATGRYSPSDTGVIPDADWTALAAMGSVVMSSHSVSCSSVTSA